MSGDTVKVAVIAAGAAVVSAAAFGAAYAFVSHYSQRLDQLEQSFAKPGTSKGDTHCGEQPAEVFRPARQADEALPNGATASGVPGSLEHPPAAPARPRSTSAPHHPHHQLDLGPMSPVPVRSGPRDFLAEGPHPSPAPDSRASLFTGDAQMVDGESPRAPSFRRQQEGALHRQPNGPAGPAAAAAAARKAPSVGPPGSTSAAANAQDRVQKAALDMMIAATGGPGGLAGKLVGGHGGGGMTGGGLQGGAGGGDKGADHSGGNPLASLDEYSRVITPETAMTDEVEDVCAMLVECLELRKHWLFKAAPPSTDRPAPSGAHSRMSPAGHGPLRAGVSPSFSAGSGRGAPFAEARPADGAAPAALPGAAAGGPVVHPHNYQNWNSNYASGNNGNSTLTPAGSANSNAGGGGGAGGAYAHGVASPERLPQPFAYVPQPASGHTFRMVDGVMAVFAPEDRAQAANLFPVPGTAAEFFTEMHRILRYAASGPVKSFCHHRLMLLEQKFNLYIMLNSDKEFLAQKAAPHRDFYNVRKVDTHIHHSACMHQKHLLRFIKSKLRKEPDEVVIFRDGKYLTLKEVFESLKLTGYDLNVDTLDMHADKNTFHRFDKFNLKYNPCGQSRLREIFIKQDNLIHGRFLAELTREVFSDLESSKYQHAEMRISIYGRKAMEWDILAAWVVGFELYSENNVWLIQIPRLYNVYKETGVIENFQQMLDNIFEPLFEVTADPSTHPQLHVLLSHVVGFDMVDDESKPERRPTKHTEPPEKWNTKHNCAYAYYAYYIYANLYALNKFRESRGLNTFTFRPHAGEAGDTDHLVAAFLLCENIAHGINLRKSPCLQYLYYMAQIGLCMSPLSNNSLFLDYHRNPFPLFFARGLSVSLSTDDPVMIHLTKEPLVEEYSVAAQVFKMSSADLCEIARNGVLHSGFSHACKRHWVSEDYWRPGPDGNDIHKTNVPNLRLRFRHETHVDEMRLVLHGAVAHQARKAMLAAKGAE